MKTVTLLLAIAALAVADNGVGPQPPFVPTPTEPTPPPTTPTTTPLSTTPTTPTSIPTTSSTTKPTTASTTKPTTASTSKPTTASTPKPTTASTPKPTTSPTKPPTPTPAPKPQPPSEGTWDYKDGNLTCIRIHGAIQIVIPYFNKVRNESVNATVDVPKDAHVSEGNCKVESDKEEITIQWMNNNNQTDHIKFWFKQNTTNKNYVLEKIELKIVPDDVAFPGIENKSEMALMHVESEFTTNLNHSYKCEKWQTKNLEDGSSKVLGWIQLGKLQMQAFGDLTTGGFDSAIDCDPSTPDVVPIAVGCALAILVIVVLVAYLIGRRRRQARGYLSMFTETKRESDYIPMKNLSCFQ